MYTLIGLTYFVVLLFVFIITKIKYNKYLLPNTIFTSLWTFIVLLSLSIDIGLIKPSMTIYLYALSAILTFNFVYLVFTKKSHLLFNKKLNEKKTYQMNHKNIIAFEIIAVILISPNLIFSLIEIVSNGFDLANLRNQTYIEDRFNNHILTFLFRSVPMSIFTVIMLISIKDLVDGKKKYLYIMIFNLVIEIITFGGRGKLWNFVAFFIGAMITSNRMKSLNYKQKKYLVYAFIGLIIVTMLRGEDIFNVAHTAYLYFVGPFSYLELMIQNPENFGLKEPLLLGYLTLGFLFEPLVLVLKAFIGLNFDVPSYHFNIFAQRFVDIGTNEYMFYNNNTTMLYTFIRDFGPIGVVIGTAITALLIVFFQRRAIKFNNMKYKILLIFMYSVIFDSARVYMLTNTNLIIIFITLSVIINRTNKKTNDKFISK